MKAKQFLGINNIADETRLAVGELVAATNVDVNSHGNIGLRRGRTLLRAGAAHSVYLAPFGTLAVVDSDLVLLDAAGVLLRTVYASLGYSRVWYATLPDGRVAFSNGFINGLATVDETTHWGVPIPIDPGEGLAGATPYMVTYARLSDGLEGAPTYGTMTIDNTAQIIGLPALVGYQINVYFSNYGEAMFLAGSTTTDTFTPSGQGLGTQWVGSGLGQPPVGRLLTVWTSHVLIAVDNVLWTTRPLQPDLCGLTKDFIQFPDPITLIYGTNDGVFVGTAEFMYFLAGTQFDELKAQSIASGAVALGSGVEIDLQYINEKKRPQGIQQGAVCLLEGVPQLIYGNGEILPLMAGRYRSSATEVWATARIKDGVLQYLAAPV